MLSKLKEEAAAIGINISSADENEIVFESANDTDNEVRFIPDCIVISFAAGFNEYGYDSSKEGELEKMLELEDIINNKVDEQLKDRGYYWDTSEIAYGVDNPDFRVLLVEYFKDIKDSPIEVIKEIQWALDFIDKHRF